MEAKKAKSGKKRQKRQKSYFCIFLPIFCPFCFSIFPAKVSFQIQVGPSCSIAYPKMELLDGDRIWKQKGQKEAKRQKKIWVKTRF